MNYLPLRNGILRGFFADYLDGAIFLDGEEAGGVGVFEKGGFAGLDDLGEVVEHGKFVFLAFRFFGTQLSLS